MVQYNYDIVVDSQLGPRHGTLLMSETDNAISGILSLLGFENKVSGKREGQMLYLQHKLRTFISHFSCQTELEMSGNALSGIIRFEHGSMKLRGKSAAEAEEQIS